MFSCEFFQIPKNTFYTEHHWATASSQTVKLVVMTKVFFKNRHTKLKLNGSYSLNISSLYSFAIAEINVFLVHSNHEDPSLHKTKFSTKFGNSSP